MEKRDLSTQGLHDRVISYIESHLRKDKYDIYTNPGTEKKWSVRGEFPDVLVAPKGETKVHFVLEVETSSTVTPEEARDQWKAYSGLPGKFYLIVPFDDLPLARQIIAGQGIEATVGYFEVGQKGLITVKYNANESE